MGATSAGLGFRLHTGWAAFVVAAGQPGEINILHRSRIELLPDDGSVPRFVYHQAAELSPRAGQDLVVAARDAARRCSEAAVQEIMTALEQRHISIRGCGMPKGSTVVPEDLSRILGSHALIHAAEGALFQNALAEACNKAGIEVVTTCERDLWSSTASAYGVDAVALRGQIDALRQTFGPPWGADQKIATAAALIALAAGPARCRAGKTRAANR